MQFHLCQSASVGFQLLHADALIRLDVLKNLKSEIANSVDRIEKCQPNKNNHAGRASIDNS
ncbi:hypothetical protein T02_3768 [Trichinella nativa]|uniref:Uncharacterized protein n=2 Tax=Trichinella TaxID=6333 RepID=A0A0V1L5F0_9BILA|nr:hypothetical protein T05_780 [Trichinella murrelli]KRZ54678.1 hypothetical protein T02_3768 [Trichinella nativa]